MPASNTPQAKRRERHDALCHLLAGIPGYTELAAAYRVESGIVSATTDSGEYERALGRLADTQQKIGMLLETLNPGLMDQVHALDEALGDR